jgi:HD-GYP domain-containing protein (c-di-GMP phosphodiesterase class II)
LRLAYPKLPRSARIFDLTLAGRYSRPPGPDKSSLGGWRREVHLNEIIGYIERTNRIAENQSWQELAMQTLELLQEICMAEAAVLNWSAAQVASHGSPAGLAEKQWQELIPELLQTALFKGGQTRLLENGCAELESLRLPCLQNLLILPLGPGDSARGAFLLLNSARPRPELAGLVARRMASELDKAAQISAGRQREVRLREINEIIGQLGASLDSDKVLRMFIEESRKFLQVEAISLFLIDEKSDELVLQVASQADKKIFVEQIRVPTGKGIIGYVTQTGETVVVDDAYNDQRHYEKIDQNSGFHTHSILAVPLRTRPIDLGQERGTACERIIGGLEAINKMDGPFRDEDKELIQILSNCAATILVVAQLYEEANNLFLEVIQAIIAAVDAKDPYTEGHSQRVSTYSVEIAREMKLDGESIYQVRLGSLFHDVGKMGIPDRILLKPGRLDDEEMHKMREHPLIGERIMEKVHLLKQELPAMMSHHEHLDGSGYPNGLRGEEITLISRIVAVADVFDAMTSNRPYRDGLPVDDVFEYLRKNIGTHFDEACVEALVRAYGQGKILTQGEMARQEQF